jgi:hypothetical protein
MDPPFKEDGFGKSPSIPLGVGLRFNLVVAAPKGPPSSVFGRLAPGILTKPSFCRLFTRLSKNAPQKVFKMNDSLYITKDNWAAKNLRAGQ